MKKDQEKNPENKNPKSSEWFVKNRKAATACNSWNMLWKRKLEGVFFGKHDSENLKIRIYTILCCFSTIKNAYLVSWQGNRGCEYSCVCFGWFKKWLNYRVFLQFQMSKLPTIIRFYTFRLILSRLLFIQPCYQLYTFPPLFPPLFSPLFFTPFLLPIRRPSSSFPILAPMSACRWVILSILSLNFS